MLKLEIEPHDPPSARKIARAVELIHGGALAAYATDSVYALGCAIESKRAVERLYRAKNMALSQRLALLCVDVSAAAVYAHFSQTAYRLARELLPGPYTFVLPATKQVPRLLLDKKRRQVGIRISAHPVAHALVRELGRPLLTSSAIPSDEDEPCVDADEIEDAFGSQLDLLIDSGSTGSEPSTVIEIDGDEVTLIRQGCGPIDGFLE